MECIKVRKSFCYWGTFPAFGFFRASHYIVNPPVFTFQMLELKACTMHVAWRNLKSNYAFLYLYGKKMEWKTRHTLGDVERKIRNSNVRPNWPACDCFRKVTKPKQKWNKTNKRKGVKIIYYYLMTHQDVTMGTQYTATIIHYYKHLTV